MQGQTRTNRRASHTLTTRAASHCNGKGAFTASLKQSTSERAMSHTHPRSAAPDRATLRPRQSLPAHRTERFPAQKLSSARLGSAAPLNTAFASACERRPVPPSTRRGGSRASPHPSRPAHQSRSPHPSPGSSPARAHGEPRAKPPEAPLPPARTELGCPRRGTAPRLPVPLTCAGRRSGHGRAAALRRVRRDWAGGPGKFLYMMEGAGPGRGEAGPRPEVEPAEGSGDFASWKTSEAVTHAHCW